VGHECVHHDLEGSGPAASAPELPGLPIADEIQVYAASINAVGKWNLPWHNIFTPQGRAARDFPSGLVLGHTLNGMPEWTYGFRDWLELGA
jgi:hypothetical protein